MKFLISFQLFMIHNFKYKVILLLWTICSFYNINAQIDIQSKIVDSETSEAIPYVNVGIATKSIGTVSDENGVFELQDIKAEDIVSITSIGYESLEMIASDLRGQEIIKLVPLVYNLSAIEIVASEIKSQSEILGVKNKNRGESVAFGTPQLGTELGASIKIKSEYYIESAHFVLNHAKGDSLRLRLNIYSFKDGQIGEKILLENVIILDKQRKGEYLIDMTPYELIVNEDILVSLEWLTNFDELGNKGITFDTKKSKKPNGIFARFASNGPFERLDHMGNKKPCIFLKAKKLK